MKPYSLLFILGLTLIFFSCKPSIKSAADYNNRLVKHQTKVGETQKELFAVFKDGKPDEMKQILNRFKSQIREITDSVSTIPQFDGKDDFKKATLQYLDQMNSIAENECTEIVRLYELPDTTFTEADQKKITSLSGLINDKTNKAINELGTKQQKFARDYHFKID
ncbi:MAG: hypothetical protein ACK5D5_01100 [Bacteroidota bacterium]|jgi:uncharacterized protein YaaN involved in tellurite resistance